MTVDGEWVDTATVDWFVSDTTVVRDSGGGWVWAVGDGFAVILARWGGATAAAAIVVDTPADSVSVSIVNSRNYQSTHASFVEGDSVLFRVWAYADRENDLDLRAVAIIDEDTLPMDSPSHVYWYGDTTTVDDPLEGSFNVFIPPHLVKPHSSLSDWMRPVQVDLDTEDQVLDRYNGTTWVYNNWAFDPDTFRLAIVPVLLGSSPDSTILEWTEGLTSDSPRIIDIQDMLPVRAGYPVSVLEPHTTEQNLASVEGWYALLSEIDSIRGADGQHAYYYGAFGLPTGSPYGGLAWLGYPVSIGAFVSNIVAHEIGHNMGLLHAPCGGAASRRPGLSLRERPDRLGQWLQLFDQNADGSRHLLRPDVLLPSFLDQRLPLWESAHVPDGARIDLVGRSGRPGAAAHHRGPDRGLPGP